MLFRSDAENESQMRTKKDFKMAGALIPERICFIHILDLSIFPRDDSIKHRLTRDHDDFVRIPLLARRYGKVFAQGVLR